MVLVPLRVVALTMLISVAAACGKNPCDGIESACVAVELSADLAATKIDSLVITVVGDAITTPEYTPTAKTMSMVTLPVSIALVFETLTTPSSLGLAFVARPSGAAEEISADVRVTLSPGEHRDLAVTLSPRVNVDAGADLIGVDAAQTTDGGVDGGGCPSEMVLVPGPSGADYCIDATEVSRGAYALFVASAPSVSGVAPSPCPASVDSTPACNWPSSGATASLPVNCVSYCQAFDYCQWAGKHLCGKIGGGVNALEDAGDPNKDEWFRACSAAASLAFPYGNTYSGSACNGVDSGSAGLVAVGSLASCVGGYPGIHDLSGNVGEWTNDCDALLCYVRGGSFTNGAAALDCAFTGPANPTNQSATFGFRCCQ